jgi:hypothetical protein
LKTVLPALSPHTEGTHSSQLLFANIFPSLFSVERKDQLCFDVCFWGCGCSVG